LRILCAAVIVGLLSVNSLSAQVLFQEDPIFYYARNGDSGAVDYLVKKGASIDSVDPSGNTVLSIGAGNGDLPMVELALEQGARVDREDKIGRTALFWAVESGSPEVVRVILDAGADINHQTRDGLTPVMAAVRSNKLAVLQLLLRQKPDLTVLDYTGRNALGWAQTNRDKRAAGMLRRAGATN
jgi:ankyrin repeat protein